MPSTGLRCSEPLRSLTQYGRPPLPADGTRSAEIHLDSTGTMYVRATSPARPHNLRTLIFMKSFTTYWFESYKLLPHFHIPLPTAKSNLRIKLVNNLGHEIPSIFPQFLLGVSSQNVSLSSLSMFIICVGEVKGLVLWCSGFRSRSKSRRGQIKRYRAVTKCSWFASGSRTFSNQEKEKGIAVLCAVEGNMLR